MEDKYAHSKSLLLLFSLLYILIFNAEAFDYTIAFTGSGASSSIDNVTVTNTTKNISVLIPSGEVLHLQDEISGLNDFTINNRNLFVFPHPLKGISRLSFIAPFAGSAIITVTDVTGKVVTSLTCNTTDVENIYQLSLPPGVFLVNVSGNGFRISQTIISIAQATEKAEISSFSTCAGTSSKVKNVTSKSLLFENGDQLIYRANSGNYSAIVADSPSGDKTVDFEFAECKDADNNYYTTVKIGDQIWMAENLKATKYNNGSDILLNTSDEEWSNTTTGSYCWYQNDLSNKNSYGALYNWFAVQTGNLAPQRWHIPSEEEFYMLVASPQVNYAPSTLCENGTAHWTTEPSAPANTTGFTALGAGVREYSFSGLNETTGYWSTSTATPAYIKPSTPVVRNTVSTYGTQAATLILNNWSAGINGNDPYKGFSIRCIKNTMPLVETGKIMNVQANSLNCEGIVVKNGGESLTQRGICWSSGNPVPEINTDSCVTGGTETGTYFNTITGLTPGVCYYLRAYATNSIGTAYGAVKTIIPRANETVTDIDGNSYSTVKIANRTWTINDLRVTKLNDGTPVALIENNDDWQNQTLAAYCKYNNTEPTGEYGYLYNQSAVLTMKLAPAGWHVPTFTEWDELRQILMEKNEGDMASLNLAQMLKESGNSHWTDEIANGNNFSGFTALPGGKRLSTGEYRDKYSQGAWWSSTAYLEEYSYFMNIDYNAYTNATENKNGLSVRCLKDYPAIVTTRIKNVKQNSVEVGLSIYDGGGALIRSGICWSNNEAVPVVNNSNTIEIPITNNEEQWYTVSSLEPGNMYYVRAFAENSTGISYGETIRLSTQSNQTVTDADGNTYHTIKIGTQTWMVENLKTTKYNDGTSIGIISGYHSTTPGYSTYANNSQNKTTYGLLYNWYAVNTGKLAPEGWRIPNKDDWQTLIDYLGGIDQAGGKLKETGLTHWESPNAYALDYGFTALPGGTRDGSSATFRLIRSRGYWWSSSQSTLDYNAPAFGLVSWSGDGDLYEVYKSDAVSVRCIKND
ncbi:MAG: FISUMP domain-containing protein [Paludibacter sp.]|nr:FISUMP domain-containing protein [Paludibacter sp.]